jgi:hypothetical protein
MPERGDPATGLHRVLDRCRAVTEERGSRVDVCDDLRQSPERGRTLARCSRRSDGLHDHLAEPEEDLADRPPAEFAVPFPARLYTDSGQRLDRPTMPVPLRTTTDDRLLWSIIDRLQTID